MAVRPVWDSSIHLVIDAAGVRPESGGAVVLGDILRAAARHSRIGPTTVFATQGARLEVPLEPSRQRIVQAVAPGRPALLLWNARGLESGARRVGADAVVSLNALGRVRGLPLFAVFQQQLMFAPTARRAFGWGFRIRLALLKRLATRACRDAALVFVQADHVRESLVRDLKVPHERIRVMPPDVSWPDTPCPAVRRQPALIAYVGSNRPHKSIATLLQAFRLVRQELPGARLELTLPAGDVPDEPGVCAVGRLDRCGVRQLLSRAEILIMPSLAETVGLPLLEAMDLGCCIVATDLPYARQASGTGAVYFRPASASDCAAKVIKLVRNSALRAQLVKRSHELIAERRAVLPYQALLDEVVSYCRSNSDRPLEAEAEADVD